MTHRRLHGALPPLNEYLRMSARAPSAPQRRRILVYDSGWWSDGAPRSISGGILGIALLLCLDVPDAARAAAQSDRAGGGRRKATRVRHARASALALRRAPRVRPQPEQMER